jgi:hypothetical protein
MVYELYQVRLTNDDILLVNSVGWEEACKLSENINAYRVSTFDKDFQKAFDLGAYIKVAEIDATDLEDTFEIGNIGPESKIKRFCSMRSISVGDVIKDPDGVFHTVAGTGFEKLSK